MERISPARRSPCQEQGTLRKEVDDSMIDDNTRQIHQVAAALLRGQDRDRKPLPARLQNAISRATMLSTISRSASDAGYTTAGKTEGKLPPGAKFTQSGELVAATGEFNLESYLAPIRHLIEKLEGAVDDEQGLGEARHHATKTGDELDQEILRWEGTPSHVVATKAPWLGSPRTIERVRIAHDKRPSDGRERTLRAA